MTAGAAEVVGTLAYMAPEAQRTRPIIGPTSNALGMIFREMLVGRHRSMASDSAVTDLMERMHHAPAHVRSIDVAIPEPVDEIIARCLEPDPAKRYQTTSGLVRALDELDEHGHQRPTAPRSFSWRRRLVVIAAVGALLAAGALVGRRVPGSRPKTASVDPVSVLIADFDNRAKDPAFDGALEQALAIALEGASFITAYPRRDALRLAGELKPANRLEMTP